MKNKDIQLKIYIDEVDSEKQENRKISVTERYQVSHLLTTLKVLLLMMKMQPLRQLELRYQMMRSKLLSKSWATEKEPLI